MTDLENFQALQIVTLQTELKKHKDLLIEIQNSIDEMTKEIEVNEPLIITLN